MHCFGNLRVGDNDLYNQPEIKKANRVSHRYNYLPLLLTRPGGIQ